MSINDSFNDRIVEIHNYFRGVGVNGKKADQQITDGLQLTPKQHRMVRAAQLGLSVLGFGSAPRNAGDLPTIIRKIESTIIQNPQFSDSLCEKAEFVVRVLQDVQNKKDPEVKLLGKINQYRQDALNAPRDELYKARIRRYEKLEKLYLADRDTAHDGALWRELAHKKEFRLLAASSSTLGSPMTAMSRVEEFKQKIQASDVRPYICSDANTFAGVDPHANLTMQVSGKHMVIQTPDSFIIQDVQNGKRLDPYEIKAVGAFVWSLEGDNMHILEDDHPHKYLRTLNLTDRKERGTYILRNSLHQSHECYLSGSKIYPVVRSPQGTKIYHTDPNTLAPDSCLQFGHYDRIKFLAAKDNILFVTTEQNEIVAYDMSKGENLGSFTGHKYPAAGAIVHNGVLITHDAKEIKIWDAQTQKEIKSMKTENLFVSIGLVDGGIQAVVLRSGQPHARYVLCRYDLG